MVKLNCFTQPIKAESTKKKKKKSTQLHATKIAFVYIFMVCSNYIVHCSWKALITYNFLKYR